MYGSIRLISILGCRITVQIFARRRCVILVAKVACSIDLIDAGVCFHLG